MDSIKTREFKSRTLVNAGDISSKTNTWPISNNVRNGPNLQSYLFQEYTSLNPSRVEQNYGIYLFIIILLCCSDIIDLASNAGMWKLRF